MAGIKDVAALAGVSISTVSYVMTGKRPIGGKYPSESIASRAETWLLGEKRWSSSVEW